MSDFDNGKPPGQNVIYAPDTSVIPKENDPSAGQPKDQEYQDELEELAANGETLPEPETDNSPPPPPQQDEGDEEGLNPEGDE